MYRFGALIQGHGGLRRGRTIAIDPAKQHRLDVQMDPLVPEISIRLDGVRVFDFIPDADGIVTRVHNVTIGRNDIGGPIGPVFAGHLSAIPFATPECSYYRRKMVSPGSKDAGA